MKIVFASYVYAPGFTSPQLWLKRINCYIGILEALAKNHKVISIEHIDYEGEYAQNGVHYHFRKFSKVGRYLPYAMNSFIKKQKPDVVFIHGLDKPLQVVQLRLILGKNTPIIIQNHAEKPFTGIRKQLQRIAGRSINATLFASYAMGAEWITKGNLTSPEKIHEVMEVSSVFHQVDKLSAKAKTGVNGQPIFLWVGRLNQNKDPLTVVKAFLAFVKNSPDARLYMIYQNDELINEIKAALVEDHRDAIVLVGKISHDDLLYWYNSADFIVASSYYEGSGTAVCEAMSCGCVPVLSDIFSFRMMTDNGRFGVSFEPGNEEQLLSALMDTQQMDMDDQKAKTLAYYQSNLSFEAIAKRFEEIATSL